MSQTRLPNKLSPILAPYAKSVSTNVLSTQRSPFRPSNRRGDETPTSPLLPAAKLAQPPPDASLLPSPFKGAQASPAGGRAVPTDFEAAEALAWLASGFENQKEEAACGDSSCAAASEDENARSGTRPSPVSSAGHSRGLDRGQAPRRAASAQLPRQVSAELTRRPSAKAATDSLPSKRRAAAGGPSPSPSAESESQPPRTYSLTSRVGQAAVSILEYVRRHEQTYLDSGLQGVPERVLRQEFGNNPDTSKALRCLVSEGELQRRGRGGRKDPFSYTRPCAAASLPSASRSSEAEDDALTRALSLVKRRKRTSLACEAMRWGGAPPDAASVPGSCAASGPPACHAGPAIPPTMLHAYVMALTAQSRDAPAAPPLGGADAPGAAWERAPSDRAHPLPYWRQGVSPH
ncbi:hypothetical protein QBZ16_003426 [Prototheca wickerhamii]|uniref:Uncharacterized protein n=1 Tax=Prototheca wickerhamii TaxID=3111 RepID=A0AAD9MNE1_PROWI|nr:hypothetical protein QBZ16_003426 [Prototheca wickerhamii]